MPICEVVGLFMNVVNFCYVSRFYVIKANAQILKLIVNGLNGPIR